MSTAVGAQGEAADPGRPRSARTWPALVVVLVVLVVAGVLLFDVIAVRTGHQAWPWRVGAAGRIADRGRDDPWVLAGGGVVLLLGVLLLWLAFAAGERRWLPLREPGAVIDRAGVAALISERAGRLPEVDRVRVKVTARRTRVTIAGAADPAAVQRELREELARIPLAVPNRLDVRTRGYRPAPPPPATPVTPAAPPPLPEPPAAGPAAEQAPGRASDEEERA
ncbi:DUF6286 domain-containing protein [Kitasatospora sp. NPDC094015]|uniref:DUF6286 domain-containing protein n=1 Tax=Kitasatospora sp. NPDC094015 TaxID=3155205 RepID=UPI00331F2CE8